jgi:hypothetical protein
MQLTGRYCENGIDLAGDGEAINFLAQAIRQTHRTNQLFLHKPKSRLPDPYDGFALSLEIRVTNSLVCISRCDDQIGIAGSSDLLEILAQNVGFVTTNSGSNHLHIEFYPSHFFLDPESIPLVITRLD